MGYNFGMKKFFPALAAAALGLVLPLSACNVGAKPKKDYYFDALPSYGEYMALGSDALEGRGHIMGTEVLLRIVDGENFKDEGVYNRAVKLWQDVCAMLTEVNSSISVTVESSCISAFNAAAAGERIRLNETAYEILLQAKDMYERTDGYFNPAVYYSVGAFGFNGGDRPTSLEQLPDKDSLSAYTRLSAHFADVQVTEENGAYYALKPAATVKAGGEELSLKLDLGGIGKGWCADRVDEMVTAAGFEYGYFSFSASTLALKSYRGNEDGTYKLRPYDPRGKGFYSVIPVKNERLSSSGDNQQFYEIDGVRYCHIIDPFTGAPIQTGVASVTVVGGLAGEADTLTTALSAMGKDRAVEYINSHLSDKFVIMLIFEGGQGKIITNRPESVTVLNEAYSIVNTVEDGKIILN